MVSKNVWVLNKNRARAGEKQMRWIMQMKNKLLSVCKIVVFCSSWIISVFSLDFLNIALIQYLC